jgi:hypothetical protein
MYTLLMFVSPSMYKLLMFISSLVRLNIYITDVCWFISEAQCTN